MKFEYSWLNIWLKTEKYCNRKIILKHSYQMVMIAVRKMMELKITKPVEEKKTFCILFAFKLNIKKLLTFHYFYFWFGFLTFYITTVKLSIWGSITSKRCICKSCSYVWKIGNFQPSLTICLTMYILLVVEKI